LLILKQWDQPEDRLGLFGLGFAAVAAFWASTNLVAVRFAIFSVLEWLHDWIFLDMMYPY